MVVERIGQAPIEMGQFVVEKDPKKVNCVQEKLNCIAEAIKDNISDVKSMSTRQKITVVLEITGYVGVHAGAGASFGGMLVYIAGAVALGGAIIVAGKYLALAGLVLLIANRVFNYVMQKRAQSQAQTSL